MAAGGNVTIAGGNGIGGGAAGNVILAATAGNVGIGTSAPIRNLSLGNTAARSFGIEDETATGVAGKGLTVFAGSAVGATTGNGGILELRAGLGAGIAGNGGSITLTPGAGAGSGAAGAINLSGETRINAARAVWTASTPPASAAGEGAIYYDTAAAGFRVSENAGAYTNLAKAAGSVNQIGKFTGAATLGNSLLADNGTSVSVSNAATLTASNACAAGYTRQGLWCMDTDGVLPILRTASATEAAYTATVVVAAARLVMIRQLAYAQQDGTGGTADAVRACTAPGPSAHSTCNDTVNSAVAIVYNVNEISQDTSAAVVEANGSGQVRTMCVIPAGLAPTPTCTWYIMGYLD